MESPRKRETGVNQYSKNYDKDRNNSQLLAIISIVIGVGGLAFMGFGGMMCGIVCILGLFIAIPGLITGFMALKGSRTMDDNSIKILSIIGILTNTLTISISFMAIVLVVIFLLFNLSSLFFI